MTTVYITHEDGLGHVTPPGHPEQMARLSAIHTTLDGPDFAALAREDAPLCDDAPILLCHPQSYITRVAEAIPTDDGFVSLDADTHLSKGSLTAARRGVGGCVKAVDMVLDGEARNAFVAMRPPGHHAETQTAMGFCLFGNVAIAAKHALETHGLSRVAVVDFDVHHGNGTQDLLWDEPRALFISTHQMPLYPGTGAANERGAHGQILNLPLPPGTGSEPFRATITGSVLPALRQHKPDLLMISAGFDAHMADPLANMNLTTEDFAWITEQLCAVADEVCDGRVVSTLEGGYDLDALAASVAAHVTVLMKQGAT